MTRRSTSSQGRRRCRTLTSPGFFRTSSAGPSRTCLSPLSKPRSGWNALESPDGQSKGYSLWRHTSAPEDRRPPFMTRCAKFLDDPRDLLSSSRGIMPRTFAATECTLARRQGHRRNRSSPADRPGCGATEDSLAVLGERTIQPDHDQFVWIRLAGDAPSTERVVVVVEDDEYVLAERQHALYRLEREA